MFNGFCCSLIHPCIHPLKLGLSHSWKTSGHLKSCIVVAVKLASIHNRSASKSKSGSIPACNSWQAGIDPACHELLNKRSEKHSKGENIPLLAFHQYIHTTIVNPVNNDIFMVFSCLYVVLSRFMKSISWPLHNVIQTELFVACERCIIQILTRHFHMYQSSF